jgi:hypothetical protein
MSYSKGSVKTTTTRRIIYGDIGSKKKEFLDLFSKYILEKGYRRSPRPIAPHLLDLEFEKSGFNLYYARPAIRVDKKEENLIVRFLAFVRIKTVLALVLPALIDLFVFLFLIFEPSLQPIFIEKPMVIIPPLVATVMSIFVIFLVIPSLILASNRRGILKILEEISDEVASELGGTTITSFTTSYETLTPISAEKQMKTRMPFIAQIKFERIAIVLSWINPILAGIYMYLKYREIGVRRLSTSLVLGFVHAYMLFLVLTTTSSTNISLLGLISIASASLISLTQVFKCPNCRKEVQVKKQKCPYCNTEFT